MCPCSSRPIPRDSAPLVAELRGIGLDELAQIERANALALFQKMT